MIGNTENISNLLEAVETRNFGKVLDRVIEGVDRDDWLSVNFTLFDRDDKAGMHFLGTVVRYCAAEFPDNPIVHIDCF